MMGYEALLSLWFDELTPADWFGHSERVDALLAKRAGDLPDRADAGELDGWAATAGGALALVLVLDQLPRNLFRGTPRAFAYDTRALAAAKDALARGFDAGLPATRSVFLYLPFEHSEVLAEQERSLALFEALGDARFLDYARAHHRIVAQFGRFPHRNAILGRASTDEERTFLQTPGSSF